MDNSMQKTVVITGCTSGIGRAAAADLLARGYRIIGTCRKTEDLEKLTQLGYTSVQLDLDDADSVDRAADEILTLTGNRLFALFNNGGFGLYGPLRTLSRQQIEKQFATNFFGVHQLTMRLLPALEAHGDARIVNTSSVMGIISTPGRGAYAASKYALEAWSDALRLELRQRDVRVSLIEPGPIQTAFTDNVTQGEPGKPVRNPGIAARFTLPPEAILPKLRHALESAHPRLRYPVTLVAHAMSVLKRLLPGWLLDRILVSN